MIAPLLALAAALGAVAVPNSSNSSANNTNIAVAPGRGRRCEPYASRCRGRTIYTCTDRGRWQRGPVCRSRRGRRVVCEVEPGGVAVCVESSATPFPGDRR